jgi:hypothetical protein
MKQKKKDPWQPVQKARPYIQNNQSKPALQEQSLNFNGQ